jgi:transcription elongation factor GreA
MSRAFVKEDAQAAAPQWRKASLTGEGGRLALTFSGANRLREELKRLNAAAHPPSVPGSETAQRIALLEDVLGRSEIVDGAKIGGDRVTFGATVVLQEVEAGTRARYRIVGELEADLKLGRISVTSPLARALIGQEVGELVQVKAPAGAREYEIVELLWVED